MFCVHNVIAAYAGLIGVEGLLIKRNLIPMADVGGIVGIVGLILVTRLELGHYKIIMPYEY